MLLSPIESMSSDMKCELGKKLSGPDMVNLCSTSKTMRRICISNRFSLVWQHKIKKDFNIVYNNDDPYNEDIRLKIFYSRTYWNLLAIDTGDPNNCWSEMYDTKEKAISSFSISP